MGKVAYFTLPILRLFLCLRVSATCIYYIDMQQTSIIDNALLKEGGETPMRDSSYNSSHQTQQKFSRGGEKKVMKKSLSLLLAIALVFGMFSAMASAATPSTPAEAGAVLKELGVLKGDDGDLLEGTVWKRQDIVVLLARLLGKEDAAAATEKSHTFKDVPKGYYDGFLSWAKAEGYVNGYSATKFGFNDELTVKDFAAVVLRALGIKNDETIAADAVKAGIFAEGTDFAAKAKRGDTFVALVAALNAEVAGTGKTLGAILGLPGFPSSATISSAAATGAKKITVTFAGAVDSAKAKISVLNGSTALNAKSVTFADDKKSAVVEFNNNLAAAEYTVKVEGLTETALTAKVKVEASKPTKIEFVSDKLVIDRANAAKASIGYKVSNQYGEDITKEIAALSVTTSKAAATIAANAADKQIVITLTSGTFATLDEKVLITALHVDTSTFASATVSVSAASRISSIDIVSLEIADSKVLETGADASKFKLLLDLKDQYGNAITSSAFLASYWSDVNVSVAGTSITATTAPVVTDGKVYLPITSISALTAGKSVVTIVSLTTGNKDSFELDVKEAAKVDTISLSAPELAPKGETVTIPYTALDQYGVAVKHPTTALTVTGGGTGGVATWVKDTVKDTTTLKVTLGSDAADNIVITGVTNSGKFVQLSFSTVAKAVPTTINSVKDVNALLKGATKSVNAADNLVIKDQYGRDVKLADHAGYGIKVTTDGDAATVSGNVLPATFTAAKKGTLSVTFTITKPDASEVNNSSLNYGLRVVEKSEIASYEASVAGTVYDGDAAYAKELAVNGVLADGAKVSIPYAADNFQVAPASTGLAYNTGTGKIESNGFFSEPNKDGEGSVVVTVIGATTTQIIPVTVKVSNKTPQAASLEVVDNGVVEALVEANYVSVKDDNINAIGDLRDLVNDAVKAVDQYGVELKDASEPNYTIYATNGTDGHTPGNVAAGNLVVGNTFTVTAVTTNGKAIAFKVAVID